MTRASIVVALALLVAGALACGATAGPSAGELMFDLGADDEDAGVDAGRRPLPLDGGL